MKKVLCDGGEEFKSSVLGISPCGNPGCPDVGAALGPEVGRLVTATAQMGNCGSIHLDKRPC